MHWNCYLQQKMYPKSSEINILNLSMRIRNASKPPLQCPKSQQLYGMNSCFQFARPNRLQPGKVPPSPISNRRSSKTPVSSLSDFLYVLPSRKAPIALAPCIAGDSFTPLARQDIIPRPIEMGDTLRRLLSSCLPNWVTEKAFDYFSLFSFKLQPYQEFIDYFTASTPRRA